MDGSERLERIEAKVRRANQHILDLDTRVKSFLKSKPNRVVEKIDGDTGNLFYEVREVGPVPLIVCAVAGDAIQNLRTFAVGAQSFEQP